MKRTIVFIAAIVGLATTAITVSCSKTEMDVDKQEVAAKTDIIIINPGFYIWDIRFHECLEGGRGDSLCYMSMEAFDGSLAYRAMIQDGEFLGLTIENYDTAPLDSPVREAIDKALIRGYIFCKNGCVLQDDKLVSLYGGSFVKGGEYPVIRRGADVIIQFAK